MVLILAKFSKILPTKAVYVSGITKLAKETEQNTRVAKDLENLSHRLENTSAFYLHSK